MPKAYSYARWSSVQQGRGNTLRRQLELSRAYAAKHGLDLDESFRDSGVSAYRGKNRTEGALGNFIKEIEAGRVESGSYLLMESLDRLSREEVLVALELFISIVRRGIIIVTLLDEQEYDVERIKNNVGLLYRSIGVLERAHEESETKGKRVADANAKKRDRARQARTPITTLCPGWLQLVRDGRGFEGAHYEFRPADPVEPGQPPKPSRAEVVRRIFMEAIAGFGKRRIANRLNDDEIPAFRGEDGWHESSVGKILENEAVLGIFQPHRKVDGKRVADGSAIRGYFPPIFDESEEWIFWRAQEAVKSRRTGAAGRKGKENQEPNLFSGIGVCDVCGGKLRYINKGPKPKGGQYLVCQRALRRHRCKNDRGYAYEPFEHRMLHHLGGMLGIGVLAPELMPRPNGALSDVTALEGRLAGRRAAQKRFIDNFMDADDPVLAGSIRTLTDEIKQIEVELREARRAAKMSEHVDRRDILERLIEAHELLTSDDPKDRQLARAKLAQHFRRVVGSMRLREDRHMIVQAIPNEHGVIYEYDLDADGELVVVRAILPDGDTMRFQTALFRAVFPSFDGLAELTERLFATRATRPAMTQQDYLDQVLRPADISEQFTVQQIGEKEYEIVIRNQN